jgi:hypothetical protein
MNDPFVILGVPPSATPAQVRTAFRRLCLRHHPDRNPGDPTAAARFMGIVRAYRAALRGPRTAAPEPPPAGPRPDRYGCASCGDTFPFPERCPRCAIELHDRNDPRTDRHAGRAAETDPRVEAFVRELERRPPVAEPDSVERLPAPALMAGTFLAAGGLVWTLGGPIGPALLVAGFAVYVAAVEGHRIFQTG